MKRTLTLLGAALLLLPTITTALVVAGCGGGGSSPSTSPTPSPTPHPSPTPSIIVSSGFTITSISPTSGPASGNTRITVTGTGFTSAVAQSSLLLVFFGGYPCYDTVIVNDTTITASTSSKVSAQGFTVPVGVCNNSGCTEGALSNSPVTFNYY